MSTFVHMELSTSDVKAAKQFYKALFGWKYKDMKMPEGVYTGIVTAEGQPIGGMQKNPMPEAPNNWLGYVGVASVKKTIAKVTKLGGTVLVPETEVGGMGKLAIFTDPQGAAFAIWESAAPAPAEPASESPAEEKSAKKKAAKKQAAKKTPAKSAEASAEAKPAKPAKKAAAKKAAVKPAAKQAAKKPAAKKAAKK